MSATGTNGNKPARPVPRFALTKQEAADSLGMSVDSFERYVQPHLKLIRRGQLVLAPVTELARWVEASAEEPMSAQIGGER